MFPYHPHLWCCSFCNQILVSPRFESEDTHFMECKGFRDDQLKADEVWDKSYTERNESGGDLPEGLREVFEDYEDGLLYY